MWLGLRDKKNEYTFLSENVLEKFFGDRIEDGRITGWQIKGASLVSFPFVGIDYIYLLVLTHSVI